MSKFIDGEKVAWYDWIAEIIQVKACDEYMFLGIHMYFIKIEDPIASSGYYLAQHMPLEKWEGESYLHKLI